MMCLHERTVFCGESASLLHQAIIEPHQLSIIVILEYELTGANLRFLPQENPRSQVALQLLEGGTDVCIEVNLCLRRIPAGTPRS